MKLLTRITMIVAALIFVSACSKVPAGNVGIKVYLLGGAKGVDTEQLSPGRYWIGWNEDLYLFPTFSQNYVWAEKSERGNESLTFGTSEGLSVNADIGITYAIEPGKAALVFQKYRKGVDEITDIYLRNMVRDALVKTASTRKIEDVYGVGKADLISAVETMVRAEVKDIGIQVEKVYWIGDLRLPQTVTSSINAKITATQQAQQRENQVATARAQAEIDVTKAEGEAKAKLAMATAEAQAIKIQAEALSNSPGLIELRRIEKWDGKYPQVMGGSTLPMISVK